MASKAALLEALEEIENGMIKIKTGGDIWQDELVYALCQAVRPLVTEEVKKCG